MWSDKCLDLGDTTKNPKEATDKKEVFNQILILTLT